MAAVSWAQQNPEAAFEVVSIKPNKADDGIAIIRPLPDGLQVRYCTLLDLIRAAYDVPPFQDGAVLGIPTWAKSEHWDVQARVSPEDLAAMQRLTRDEQAQRLNRMLGSLLAARFGLAVHEETREGPVYTLTLAKGGPKLVPGTALDASMEGITTGTLRVTEKGRLTAQDLAINRLAQYLSRELHDPVLDKTGLTGRYDFELEWTPEDAAAPDTNLPGLFTAVEEQLGLKLVAGKGPVRVVVVDKAERPTIDEATRPPLGAAVTRDRPKTPGPELTPV